MRMPSLLVPFPAAADNHQWHNARAFEETGAAQLLEQRDATPEKVCSLLRELMDDPGERATMKASLAPWHAPKAAEQIAERILQLVSHRVGGSADLGLPEARPVTTENRAPLESAPVA